MLALEAATEQVAKADINVVTGIGVVLFIAGGSGFWALIHLRGNTVERLWSQIDIAFEALTEKAFASLATLLAHLNDLIPDTNSDFDPLDMIVDPSSVEKPAKASIRLLRERHRIRLQYKQLLWVCSLLKYSMLVFTLSVAVATVLYQFSFSETDLWQRSFLITALVGVVIIFLVAAYTVLITRIDGVIENTKTRPVRVGASK